MSVFVCAWLMTASWYLAMSYYAETDMQGGDESSTTSLVAPWGVETTTEKHSSVDDMYSKTSVKKSGANGHSEGCILKGNPNQNNAGH